MSRRKRSDSLARVLAKAGNDPVVLQKMLDAMDQLIAARKPN